MKSEELPKERTLAKCSCCQGSMWSDGPKLFVFEWRLIAPSTIYRAPLSICNDCVSEADDQGITVEQLTERNNERSVETESY